MKNISKKSGILFLTVMLCFCFLYLNGKIAAAGSTGNYLVLIEQEDGSWKEYTNLIELSKDGKLMVKAKAVSAALGVAYKNNSSGTFTLKRSSARYNTYTKNSKSFTYVNGSKSTGKTASYKAYTSASSKSNLCGAATLGTLVNYKYFGGTKAKAYGYSGVVCYSTFKKIPADLPLSKYSVKTLKDFEGTWYSKDYNQKGDEPYSGSVMTIEPVGDKEGIITISCVSLPPFYRIADIESEVKINSKNTARFYFDDDGWGNSGSGTITFEQENRLSIKIKFDTGPEGNWSLFTDNELFER